MIIHGPKMFIMFPVLILLLLAAAAVMILVVRRCSKRRAIAVLVPLVLLPLFAFVLLTVSHRRAVAVHEPAYPELASTDVQDNAAAIWQPGIEEQFEADVYSSRLSAVRSLGLRIAEPVRTAFGQTPPSRIILFRGAHDRELLEQFGEAVSGAFPGIQWTSAPETVAVQEDEVGIRLDLVKVQTHPAPWLNESGSEMISGTIQASVLAAEKQASIRTDFVEKPWVEDFSGFSNTKPTRQLIIAKSKESCTTQAEANHQALENACAQVTEILSRISRRQSGIPSPLAWRVDSDDLLENGLVLDRFVQSFAGSAGRIWRQALLIDGSTEKIERLAHRKAVMARAMKKSWARMFASVLGLLVLITVVYAFLNAATKGYYAWSLRIAGAVLAAVVIILLLV